MRRLFSTPGGPVLNSNRFKKYSPLRGVGFLLLTRSWLALSWLVIPSENVLAEVRDLLDSENQGNYLDLTERLSGVTPPSAALLQSAPESCRSGSGEAAFRAGHREAQEGRHFIPSFAFRLDEGYHGGCPHHSPTRNDRRGCQAYRGSDDRAVNLPCCEIGFRAGISKLGRRIAGALNPTASSAAADDEGMRQCLRDFQRGEEFGLHFCRPFVEEGVCYIPPRACLPTRYLNCFHLGAFSKMTEGGCAGVESVARQMQQIAPSLNHRRAPVDRSSAPSSSSHRTETPSSASSGGRAE